MTDLNSIQQGKTLTESELTTARDFARRILTSAIALNPTGAIFFPTYLARRIPNIKFSDEICDDVFECIVDATASVQLDVMQDKDFALEARDIAHAGFAYLDQQLSDESSFLYDCFYLLPQVKFECLEQGNDKRYEELLGLILEDYQACLYDAVTALNKARQQRRNPLFGMDGLSTVTAPSGALNNSWESYELQTEMRLALNDSLASHVAFKPMGSRLIGIIINYHCPYLGMPADICADLYKLLFDANLSAMAETETTLTPYSVCAAGLAWFDSQLANHLSAFRIAIAGLPTLKDSSLRGNDNYQRGLDSVRSKYTVAITARIHELDKQSAQMAQASANAANHAAAEFLKGADAPATDAGDADYTGETISADEFDVLWDAAHHQIPQATVTKKAKDTDAADATKDKADDVKLPDDKDLF